MRTAVARADRWRRVVVVVALSAVVVAACGSDDPAVTAPVANVPETVARGAFPEPPSSTETLPVPPTSSVGSTVPTTEPPPEPIDGLIGDEVVGNRVLVIGDTVFASAAPRFGGSLCDALEAFGWQAEIAAEVGRFVEFGRTVVDARIVPQEPEWDAVAIMLGNHFDGDAEAYRVELDGLLTEVAPRPVLLYTLVEDDTYQAELNEIIREMPRFHAHVVVLDWAEIIDGEDAEVALADTPSGLSEEGLGWLTLRTVAALGEPPTAEAAGCVPPVFVDDSAIVI